jgi:hypothetical protein
MTAVAIRWILLAMAEDDASVTVTIRLTPDSMPMRGVVVVPGEETPFAGWMELAGLLESLRACAALR